MATGSWLRYVTGIVLSLDVLRIAVTGEQPGATTIGLSVLFLLLALLYLIKRI